MLGGGIMNPVNNKTCFKPLAEASFSDISIFTWVMSPKTKGLEAVQDSILLIKRVIYVVHKTTFVMDIATIHGIRLASILA
jgi:hypothetical protein